MNARILALGAVIMLAASAVDAQAPGRGRGLGKGRPVADSSPRKPDNKDHEGRKAGKPNDDDRKGMGTFRRGSGYLFAGITLTDAQQTRIKAIRESYRPRMEALRDSTKTERTDNIQTAADTAFRAKTRALVTSERAEIRTVLTAEQQVRYDANTRRMDERMERQRGRGGERSGGSKP